MASKNKRKIDEMERFAFDVFINTMSIFETKTDIPTPECKENTYEHSDFLFVISRGYICYQLLKRDLWKYKFHAKFKSNGLKTWEQIEKLLVELLEEMDCRPRKSVGRIVSSLALINELIQFLYSENRRLFFNKLSSFWRKYFASFEGDFKKESVLSHLYSIHYESFQVLNEIIDFFFSSVIIEYGKSEVSIPFIVICTDPSFKDKIKKATAGRTSANVMKVTLSLGENLSIATRSPGKSSKKSEASGSLVNIGLGIIPDEKFRDSHSLSTEKGTCAEKPIASPNEKTSTIAHADAKLPRKQCGQKSPKQKVSRQPCTPIARVETWPKDQSSLTRSLLSPGSPLKILSTMTRSPSSPEGPSKVRGNPAVSPLNHEGRSKDRGSLTGSPLSPGGPLEILRALTGSPLNSSTLVQSLRAVTGSPLVPKVLLKARCDPAGSPLSSEGRSECRGGLTVSSLSPGGPLEILTALTGSPLSPEGRLKSEGDPTGSPLSPEERSKDQGSLTGSILSPGGQLKNLSAMTGSPLDPEGRLKDRGSPAGSPLSPEERLKVRGSPAGSPSSPQEQTHRRGSRRTPTGISRLEQKRQKYRQPKKPEPTN